MSGSHMVLAFGYRGGGELGKKWYLQAIGDAKQQSAQVSCLDINSVTFLLGFMSACFVLTLLYSRT